jgi:hypothetical protein
VPVVSDYFFYLFVVVAGLWFAVYLTLALMRLKDLIRAKRTSVFDFIWLIKGLKQRKFIIPFYFDMIYLSDCSTCYFSSIDEINSNPAIQITSLAQLSFGNEYIKAKQIKIPHWNIRNEWCFNDLGIVFFLRITKTPIHTNTNANNVPILTM